MKKVLDYQVVVSNGTEDLQTKVMALLQKGYELFGFPFSAADSLCQAVLKDESARIDSQASDAPLSRSPKVETAS